AVAMVIVMQARGGDAPPPFAVFWAKFIGDGDPSEAMPQSLILHAIYAIVAGAVYAVVFNPIGSSVGLLVTTFAGGIVWGIVWAIVLLIVAMVFWGNIVLDMDPDRPQMITIVIAHLAYGLVLGILSAAVPHLV
ncbi:MAG: hypothetical protein SV377_00495, partial [Halobacteria archaeon]|nr:hypothetical protein [Halobacteria archaeon]